MLVAGATPAGAIIAKIGGRNYGLTPVRGVNAANLPAVRRALGSSAASRTSPLPYDKAEQLTSHGGPVMHSVNTHVVYWDPSGNFTVKTKEIVHKFFTDVAHDSGLASNVFGVAGQYTDGSGHAQYSSTFGTEATDGNSYGADTCTIPNQGDKSAFYTNCVTDEKLQTELSAYVTKEGLPTGPTQQYVVLFPHKVVTCLPEEEVEEEPGVFVKIHPCSNNFYCAYHSSINGGTASEIVYSDIPFSLLDEGFAKDCQADGNGIIQNPNGDTTGTDETTRYADVALKYTSHEYIEAATDPLGNGWWENAHGQEIGDKCNFAGSGFELGGDPNAFLPTLGGSTSPTFYNQLISGDHFYLQSEWDNAAKACLMEPLPLGAGSFSAPTGTAGSPVGFTGSASDPYGRFEPTWTFGDKASGVGASTTHTYAVAGEYTVTMTPKDAFTGSTGTPVSHVVTVAAAPPSGGGGGEGGATGGGGASTTQTTATTTSTAATVTSTAPNSGFTAESAANQKTGTITFTLALANPGTLGWAATFPNGTFGAFSSASKCKAGQRRLAGKCRPVRIFFAKGGETIGAPGSVTVTLKPSASARKALRRALRHKRGVPVSIVLTFQSSLGGAPVKHTQTVIVKLK